MIISSIVVDAPHLAKSTVVVEGEVGAVVQTHPREHAHIGIVWTINLQTTTKSRGYIHLSITEGNPIVGNVSRPGLSDCLQISTRIVNKIKSSLQRVHNRLHTPVRSVVTGRKVV